MPRRAAAAVKTVKSDNTSAGVAHSARLQTDSGEGRKNLVTELTAIAKKAKNMVFEKRANTSEPDSDKVKGSDTVPKRKKSPCIPASKAETTRRYSKKVSAPPPPHPPLLKDTENIFKDQKHQDTDPNGFCSTEDLENLQTICPIPPKIQLHRTLGGSEQESNDQDGRPSTENSEHNDPPKKKKAAKNVIKLDERSDMGKLADQITPQLNHMQKNLLGLLFFNELSSNMVEDMVTQQLNLMASHQLAAAIQNLHQDLRDEVVPGLVERGSQEHRVALACHALAPLAPPEEAGLLLATEDNVFEVLLTMAEYGGKSFKRDLIENLIEDEDDDFMNSIIYNHLTKTECIDVDASLVIKTATESSADDDFASCDESDDEDEEIN